MISMHTQTVKQRAAHSIAQQVDMHVDSTRRISSGKRLQSAADNVAEVAVSMTLNARNRSRLVARKNIAHAQNIMQLAQGGISSIRDAVVKLQGLAVQAATDGFTAHERAMMQQESFRLLEHINDVSFNTVLDPNQPLLYKTPVDIGFVIDNSASMNNVINDVRNFIGNFTDEMQDAGFNVAFGLAKSGKGVDAVDGVDTVAEIGSPAFDSELAGLNTFVHRMDNYSALTNTAFNDRPGDNDPDDFNWRPGSNRYAVMVTDTSGFEDGLSLAGDTEASVAAGFANAGIGFHGIVNDVDDFDDIATATGGTIQSLGNVQVALDNIESDIENDLEAVATMKIQTGVDGGTDDQLASDVAIDTTQSGLGLSGLDLSTRDNASAALDQLVQAIDLLNEQATLVGSAANRLDFLHDHTSRAIETEQAGLEHLTMTDVSKEATSFASTQVLADSASKVLQLYGQMQSQVVMNLVQGSHMRGYAA